MVEVVGYDYKLKSFGHSYSTTCKLNICIKNSSLFLFVLLLLFYFLSEKGAAEPHGLSEDSLGLH